MANAQISKKISKLVGEGKPQKQAIAIAFSIAGKSRNGGSSHNSGPSNGSRTVDIAKALKQGR